MKNNIYLLYMTTNYNEKYKKYLDKAFNAYGITPADINLPQFDTKKQYDKDDYKLLKDQIEGWEFHHPLRDIDTFQLDVEYKRLRNSGELKDALPKKLLKEYQTGKRYRGVKQDKAADYPDMTAHEMVIKNYRDEIKRRAVLKSKGIRPTSSTTGGRRKTKTRRKKKRKTKKTRKKKRRRTRKKRRTKRRRKR